MLELSKTELYTTMKPEFRSSLGEASQQKLWQGIGVITPKHIEVELLDLKTYSKKKASSSLLLLDALKMYESTGQIQLFDLSFGDEGGSTIPPFVPFLPGYAGAAITGGQKQVPAIFVNMYRMGQWSPKGDTYDGLFAITDLNACLESGYIAEKLTIEKKADQILGNATVLEYLTRIYAKMFYDALIRVPGNIPLVDFEQDTCRFVIAKFFLTYILQKNGQDDTVNEYARLASRSLINTKTLVQYEDNLGINYESLSGFLSTIGIAFFNGAPTGLSDFEKAWLSMYGEGLAFAIEYVPYLIHFLFAAIHNSRLGGSSKLDRRFAALQKEGLAKLYNAMIVAINK
jgi:hypothetical protein